MQAERRADRARIAEVEAELDQAAQRSTLRVRSDLVDRLVNQAGELSIARSRIEGEMRSLKESLLDLTENVIRLRRQLREIEIQAESQMQSRTAQAADEHHAGFDPLEVRPLHPLPGIDADDGRVGQRRGHGSAESFEELG